MKIEMKDIVLILLGAVAGFLMIYIPTKDLLAGCALGIISGVGGGALGSYIVRKRKSKKSE